MPLWPTARFRQHLTTTAQLIIGGVLLPVVAKFLDNGAHFGFIENARLTDRQRRAILRGQIFHLSSNSQCSRDVRTERYDSVVPQQTGVPAAKLSRASGETSSTLLAPAKR